MPHQLMREFRDLPVKCGHCGNGKDLAYFVASPYGPGQPNRFDREWSKGMLSRSGPGGTVLIERHSASRGDLSYIVKCSQCRDVHSVTCDDLWRIYLERNDRPGHLRRLEPIIAETDMAHVVAQ